MFLVVGGLVEDGGPEHLQQDDSRARVGVAVERVRPQRRRQQPTAETSGKRRKHTAQHSTPVGTESLALGPSFGLFTSVRCLSPQRL